MLIRFTTPCTLGAIEYASGAEADLPDDVANATLSSGRGVRVMPEPTPPVSSPEPLAPSAPVPQPIADPQPAIDVGDPASDDDARPKRR